MTARFAELVAATNYSFLRGASHPSDMVGEAGELGLAGIGIADRNTVAGVVRAYAALRGAREKHSDALAKAHIAHQLHAPWEPFVPPPELAEPNPDFRLVVGARLVFADGTPDIVVYPRTRYGWGRLTRLLTVGNRRAIKGGCRIGIDDLLRHRDELLMIVVPESSFDPEEAVSLPTRWHVDKNEDRGLLKLGEEEASDTNVLAFPTLGDRFAAGSAVALDRGEVVPLALPIGDTGLESTLKRLIRVAPDRVWLGVAMSRAGRDRRHLRELAELAARAGVPLLATNDVLHATPAQRPLHDVLTAIRKGVTVQAAGRLLEANAERHLKSPDEMARLFIDRPDAVNQTIRFLDQIEFSLDQLRYEYPHEPVPSGWDPQDWLEHLTWQMALEKFDGLVPDRLLRILYEEFTLIRERNYAAYFLTVHDVVRFAQTCDPPILCQGRGSAANSAVCWLLGVTSVNPLKYDLLFSRFLSAERNEPPDIDVDFEHERREEVMQYIYRRYGRHRAGIAATVIHYRPRSAVREVCKALGMTEDVSNRLTSTVWGSYADSLETDRFAQSGFDLANKEVARLRSLVDQLLRFPRHLSQHVGGFVLTEDRLDETVPLHNGAMPGRTFIEWDKDDIDELGLMKVDVLALGMLTCVRKAFDLMRDQGMGDPKLDTIATEDDPAVYDMLCRGDSIGVFQVESRAQINMLPRLKPRKLYDLVIEVAIVRPGPIQGDMVHPYLRRRAGKEQVEYPSPAYGKGPKDEMHTLLHSTLGVPLFQEQAMKLAIVAAGFTPNEANQLRRAMATFRHVGGMDNFQSKLVDGMARRGYDRAFAERCYHQIEGFGSYGFPESHALAFARLVYISASIKCFHPAVFCCALLNSQPMGFYAPAQLVRDAREHGVEVRAIDVNASHWDNTLEPGPQGGEIAAAPPSRALAADKDWQLCGPGEPAVRLGFRQIGGFRQDWARSLVAARADEPFDSIESLARRAGLPARALRLLADADAQRSLGHDRREALWEVRRTPGDELPLFAAARARELGREVDAALPPLPASEAVAADYQVTRLSLADHPMSFLRPIFRAEGVKTALEVARAKDGARATMAGVVLVRQRPGNGKAIFITLEDETGIANVLLWARTFEAQRLQVMAARLMVVSGTVQRSAEGVVHLMGAQVADRSAELSRLSEDHVARLERIRADAFDHPQHPRATVPRGSHPRNVRLMPKSRDFH